ncbi:hypothetical protein ACFPM0_31875 [Pseudonocardia sulfidoxydans]|uniref:hypothetical protein n=1 Tax=Pseudonocardia sulfidoxydans TaxID=54011 RepID=UPI0036178949
MHTAHRGPSTPQLPGASPPNVWHRVQVSADTTRTRRAPWCWWELTPPWRARKRSS